MLAIRNKIPMRTPIVLVCGRGSRRGESREAIALSRCKNRDQRRRRVVVACGVSHFSAQRTALRPGSASAIDVERPASSMHA
jgi:hypothetical protein